MVPVPDAFCRCPPFQSRPLPAADWQAILPPFIQVPDSFSLCELVHTYCGPCHAMTRPLGQRRELQVFCDPNDGTNLAERLARTRRTFGDRIDLPNLGTVAFATLLGVSASAYEAYERGDRTPTVDFLAILHSKTGTIIE